MFMRGNSEGDKKIVRNSTIFQKNGTNKHEGVY